MLTPWNQGHALTHKNKIRCQIPATRATHTHTCAYIVLQCFYVVCKIDVAFWIWKKYIWSLWFLIVLNMLRVIDGLHLAIAKALCKYVSAYQHIVFSSTVFKVSSLQLPQRWYMHYVVAMVTFAVSLASHPFMARLVQVILLAKSMTICCFTIQRDLLYQCRSRRSLAAT